MAKCTNDCFDGDGVRCGADSSPWSNKYFPTSTGDDAPFPSPQLRELEKAANEAFSTYLQMYYDTGLSSVYMWDLTDSNFAACILFKKSTSGVCLFGEEGGERRVSG